jgi:tetratricopeptide (TPR) repeat protein
LAELYLQQGLLERAIEVYREVLEAEPANEAARVRLAELEASLGASAPEGPTPGPGDDDERAAKRQALERTIERLEALLTIVQRR